VEARDVAGGVVERRIPGHGIRAAVGDGQEGRAAGPGQARSEAAQQVAGDAVLQRRRLPGQVVQAAAQLADRDEVDGMGRSEQAGAGERERRKTEWLHERLPRRVVV